MTKKLDRGDICTKVDEEREPITLMNGAALTRGDEASARSQRCVEQRSEQIINGATMTVKVFKVRSTERQNCEVITGMERRNP